MQGEMAQSLFRCGDRCRRAAHVANIIAAQQDEASERDSDKWQDAVHDLGTWRVGTMQIARPSCPSVCQIEEIVRASAGESILRKWRS
jgi:hypothetical protein